MLLMDFLDVTTDVFDQRVFSNTLWVYSSICWYLWLYALYLYKHLCVCIFVCVCACVYVWFTPNEPVAGGGGLV